MRLLAFWAMALFSVDAMGAFLVNSSFSSGEGHDFPVLVFAEEDANGQVTVKAGICKISYDLSTVTRADCDPSDEYPNYAHLFLTGTKVTQRNSKGIYVPWNKVTSCLLSWKGRSKIP